ncbi:MAG: hypothetical protein D6718_04080 [Acidobacteria bacterium]|nr:MAG: hypothetical protein D6718_04080 [Acidobacteriota bacterium]
MLTVTAAAVGVIHTLMGPDHYVPFVVMARVRGWSLRRTLAVTLACGVGHVGSSVLLGAVGVALGLAVAGLTALESLRGTVASWTMIGFGLAYAAWGWRRAVRGRPHAHWHTHADGTCHRHVHRHEGEHAHVHAEGDREGASLTPWILFTVFVFGPCEPLIPLLMYPAAEHSARGVVLVTLVFGAATLGTMAATVGAGFAGIRRLPLGPLERYAHVMAGATLAACGVAMRYL